MSLLVPLARTTNSRFFRSFSRTCTLAAEKKKNSDNNSNNNRDDNALRHAKHTSSLRKKQTTLLTRHRGIDIVYDPFTNRGTGFHIEQRERLQIRGLVPPSVQPLESQKSRILRALAQCDTDLEKFSFLSNLQDRNATLFYSILIDNFEQLAPIVYTPTVGQACQQQHLIYRRTRGMWFSLNDRGYMDSMVYNWPEDKVEIIVVTDGSRILGLGDLGSNGMMIPVGKLNIYAAGGGINPKRCLPVVLDTGTNNPELLQDPLYLGLQKPRLKGQEYYDFIQEWMDAVYGRWPNVLVQFEDFANPYCNILLDKYRDEYLCFNDDIQSTGCIVFATLLAAQRTKKRKFVHITEERILCIGAGSAGIGVCNMVALGMEAYGKKNAHENFWLIDKDGLIGEGRENLGIGQERYIRRDAPDKLGLLETIKRVKPTVLIGLCATQGVFDEAVLREMASYCDQPIILPLSNPVSCSECTAEEAFKYTDGKAIFASGSPFEDIITPDGRKFLTNQCNNVYNYPGLGLGIIACNISKVTDDMFLAGAEAIASINETAVVEQGRLFPLIANLRDVSVKVAEAVARVAYRDGLAGKVIPKDTTLEEYMRNSMWEPHYDTIVPIMR